MAKVSYLEIVDILSQHVQGDAKKRLDHVLARKAQLKEEDTDLNEILDGILRELQGEGRE
jgi:hypothetical protein